jgi:hypothetical protein
MKRLHVVGLCLAAAIGCSAAVAAGASAASVPTWWECAKAAKDGKKFTGDYNDKLCTSPNAEGDGKYVLREGAGHVKSIKGKSATTVLNVQTWLGDSTVECAKGQYRGAPEPPNQEVGVEVLLKKCSTDAAGPAKKCSSVGRKPGEVKLHALRGELGYISESPVVVGVKLWLESEPGGPIANFDCEGLEITVAGFIVGTQEKDVNVVTKEAETVFSTGEYLGEVEYEGHRFSPLVNLLGFADELEAIARLEAPPSVLTTTICGAFIEGVLGKPCTPQTFAGLDQTMVSKGETLMIKA